MIPKAFRLVLSPYQPFLGQKHHYPWGMVIVASASGPRWTVAVSKRAVPSAVKRNRLRRQLMQLLYVNRSRLDPSVVLYIIIARKTSDHQTVIRDLCSFLSIES